jgi:hypothetical protein
MLPFSSQKTRRGFGLLLAIVASPLFFQPLHAQNSTVPVLSYSTFLGGGTPNDYGETGCAVAVGPGGFVYVMGVADTATSFPFTVRLNTNGYLGTNAAEGTFVAKFDPATRSFAFISLIPWCSGRAIAVDSNGNAYIAGFTDDLFLASTNAFQSDYAGGGEDAMVAKLSADGSNILYATYLGGSGSDLARGIAVDTNGRAIVTGVTDSTNFPVTPNAAQPHLAGGYDSFVTILDATGSKLRYSTYLGGEGDDLAMCLAVDGTGNISIAGESGSTNFASVPNVIRIGTNGSTNAFIAKLAADLSAVRYITLIGDSNTLAGADDGAISIAAAVAVDAAGDAYLFGQTSATNFPVTANAAQHQFGGGVWDDFVAKLDPSGSNLLYCTYLGGSRDETLTEPIYIGPGYLYLTQAGLAVDAAGDAYVAGQTQSPDAPTGTIPANLHTGDYSGYVAKLDPTGSTCLYFRYVGNSTSAGTAGLALAGNGNFFVTGYTGLSPNAPYYPVTPDAFQSKFGGGWTDGFLAEFSETASIAANDQFANRTELKGSRLTVQANNQDATAETGEPAHAGIAGSHSLWWSWTAPADGKLGITTTGSGLDALLSVYTNNALNSLQVVASNYDQIAIVNTNAVRFQVGAGTNYQISVDGESGETGSISLSLTFSAPVNDDFTDAIALAGFPTGATGSNIDATLDLGENADYGIDRSVWWTWQAPDSRNVVISTLGSSFYTELIVFTNDTLGNLTEAAEPNSNPTNSVVTLQAQAGTLYYLAVLGYDNAAGTVNLKISSGMPPTNDNFSTSTVLTGTLVSDTNNNIDATAEPNEPPLGNGVGIFDFLPAAGRTLWWTWTAPTDGWVRISTTNSDFFTRVGVFTGGDLTNLTPVAAGDGEIIGQHASHVNFPVESNTEYHIAVDGSESDPAGTIVLWLFFYQPPIIASDSVGGASVGPFHFSVTNAVPGQSYVVQTSTNLINWTNVPGALQGANFQFSDTNSAESAARYYRLMEGN